VAEATGLWPVLLCLALIICLLHGLLTPVIAHADSPRQGEVVTWSTPINLSNTPQNSDHPAVAADGYGRVHVLWSEDLGGAPTANNEAHTPGNSIMYRGWDGNSWSEPVDVLFVPDEVIAEFVNVEIDQENTIHAIWNGYSNFYYSAVPALFAGSGDAWSRPIAIARDSARSPYPIDIAVDRERHLHVVYATRGPDAGIYHVRSLDNGKSWEFASKLTPGLEVPEESLSSVMAVCDAEGGLHVVWQTNDSVGIGYAVYYSRSLDSGSTFSEPVKFKQREAGESFVEWPYIIVTGQQRLGVLYTNGGIRGRAYQESSDRGLTWSKAVPILTEMEGVNGYVVPLLDAARRLRLVVNMRTTSGQVNGVYFTTMDGRQTLPVQPIDVASEAAPWAHSTSATVRLGNEVHLVYVNYPGFDIWYAHGHLPQTQALRILPTPAAMEIKAEAVSTSEFSDAPASQLAMPTPVAASPVAVSVTAPGSGGYDTNNSSSVFVGGASALVLVLIVLLAQLRRRY
jgi:hypothetical protein